MRNGQAPLAPMWPTDLDATSPRLMLEHNTANAICENANNYSQTVAKHHRDYYDRLRTALTGYQDETLRRISVPLSTSTHNFELIEMICYDNFDEDIIHDWYTMVEHNIRRNAVARFAVGLAVYKNLAPIQDGHYPAQRLAQVGAIIRVTDYLFAIGKVCTTEIPKNLKLMTYIDEEALRDQLDTYSHPAALADIIINRDLTTSKQVAEFLATTDQLPSPLKEGAL